MARKSSSIQRVAQAAEMLGLNIRILEMDASTRTAEEAAAAAECDVAQIVKSLVFTRKSDDCMVLALVSGAHHADMSRLEAHFGDELERADPRQLRSVTGFAIGGVAPIGHLTPLPTVMDETLLQHDMIWAAAGKPNAIFQVESRALLAATGGQVMDCS